MCIIMLGGEDTHPWSATRVGDPIPATILVRIDDTLSTVGEVSSGVPQESVVGPLFFLAGAF